MLSLLAAIVAGFLATLALAPHLPDVQLRDPRALQALHIENAKHLKGRPSWQHISRPKAPGTNTAIKPLTVGFYVSWDAESRASLAQHVNNLDVVAPQWITMKDAAGDVDITDDPQAVAVISAAAHPPAVLPVVHNYTQGSFNAGIADALLRNPAAQDKLIATLVAQAQKKDYSGYILDIENIPAASLPRYPAFIAKVKAALAPLGREVWVTAPFDDDDWPLKAMQDASDTLMLMAYDQHWQTGQPGPTAGEDWFEKYLDSRLSKLDPDRLIMALGSYGYDWTQQGKAYAQAADPVTFHEAIQTANDSGVDIVMDDDALNPHYAYIDDGGLKHQVWFLDATTVFNQIKVTDPWRPRGYALWRLGSEDPGVWSLFGSQYGAVSPNGLVALAAGAGVDFDGAGEVLKVTATPRPGKRSLTFDPDTGLIADQHYDVLPTSYVIDRYGSHPGWIALTFDDGPDGRWTAKILDILKEKNAPATFFLIGKNMQAHPGVVRREIDQGMVLGSHTYTHPNIASLPEPAVDLELNATQRLFAVITGKSFRLFRPPYFGDAEPSTPAEVNPLLQAQKLGYLIVGLRIDTDDWKKPPPNVIVQRVFDRLAQPATTDEPAGQVVLLHDSGGDRSNTVAALPTLIDQLRAKGYTLVTIDQLAGLTHDQAMPPTNRGWLELTLDRIGFGIFREVDIALTALFITAIALGVLRLIFLVILAVVHRLGEDKRRPADIDPETGPLVSVLIPCFNEEKVIAASLARILESNWSRLEVLVLDDGSSDGTSAEVEKHFSDEPRVRLMRFPNGGKALALNRGLDQVKGDIIVALDADTLFPPSTIGRLAPLGA